MSTADEPVAEYVASFRVTIFHSVAQCRYEVEASNGVTNAGRFR